MSRSEFEGAESVKPRRTVPRVITDPSSNTLPYDLGAADPLMMLDTTCVAVIGLGYSALHGNPLWPDRLQESFVRRRPLQLPPAVGSTAHIFGHVPPTEEMADIFIFAPSGLADLTSPDEFEFVFATGERIVVPARAMAEYNRRIVGLQRELFEQCRKEYKKESPRTVTDTRGTSEYNASEPSAPLNAASVEVLNSILAIRLPDYVETIDFGEEDT